VERSVRRHLAAIAVCVLASLALYLLGMKRLPMVERSAA
jgi:hypothetical protein